MSRSQRTSSFRPLSRVWRGQHYRLVPSDLADTGTAVSRPAGGLRSPFSALWTGQSASLLGDQVTLIALPLLATGYAAASTLDIGLLGMCLRLPFLLIGLPAGVWVTRLGLLRSMIGADIARGLAVGLLPALALAGQARMPLLLAAAAVVGMGTVFFQISYQSLVPELIPDEAGWHGANTRLSLSESAALLCGPALGGLVVSLCAPPGALAADAGTYAASVATLMLVARRVSRRGRRRPAGSTAPRAQAGSTPLRAQVRDGLRYVRHSPVLNALMWTGAAYNLGSAMYDSALIVYAVHVLHLTPAWTGLAIAAGGVGFPVSSALSGKINRRFGLGPSLIAAAVPSVAGLVVASLAAGPASWWLLALGTLLVGLGQGCFAVNAITLRQFAAVPSMRAQATAVHRFVSWGALPVGSLATGIVGQEFGVRTAVITAGLTSATCFWPLLRSPLRSIKTTGDADGRSRDPARHGLDPE
jgi:MFS family permease